MWKPYFYIQPDAGAALGTPYALAAEWHGKGTAWTQIYNFTKKRPLGGVAQAAGGGKSAKPEPDKGLEYDPGTGKMYAAGKSVSTAGYVGEELTPSYADVGDKLLIPFEWPETTNQTILKRLEPIPMETSLPGVSGVSGLCGDDTPNTI